MFTDADQGVSFRCDLDGALEACGSPDGVVSYSGLADGVHTFSVQAIDQAGLTTDSAPYVWRISTQGPPTPSLDAVTPATTPTNSTTMTFAFSDSQAGASFMCAFDGGVYQPCTSPKPYNGLTDGVHTFSVRAQDALGNVSSVAPYTWTTDTTPPTITAVVPTKGQTVQALDNVNADYSCADNLGIKSCVGTAANGGQLDTKTLGLHPFTVTATDTAGNTTTVDLGYTVVNNTLPAVTIGGPTDGQSFTWGQGATASYTCSSPVGVASCVGTMTAAGTASDPASTSTPVANGGALPTSGAPGPGSRTLTVTATDTYGAVSTQAVNYTVEPAGYYGLTFDDGPDATFTQPILNELHQFGATAAFFLIGQNVAQYPALAKAEVTAGMTVGDHTWDHSAVAVDPSGGNPAPVPYTCPTPPPNRQPAAGECVPWQLEDASDAIFDATGVRPQFFRPPYGSYDTGTIALLNSLPAPYNGMALTAWTTDTNDWAGATTAQIVQTAVTVPSGGIILMHDAQQTTVDAVPQIITQMADTRGMLPGKLAVGGDWVGPFCGPAGDPCPPPFQPNWSVSAVAPAS